MPIDVKIAMDAAEALNELGRLNNTLDTTTDALEAVNSVQASFNRRSQQTISIVKSQVDQFTTLTQVFDRNGRVIESTYFRNDAAARKFAENEAKRQAKAAADAEKERQRLENQAGRLEQFFNRLGRNLTQFATYRAFNVITDQLHEGVTAAKDFQIQLSLIRTLSQDSQQSFSKFGQDVRKVSDQSGINIKDVGKAFYNVASDQVAKGADIAPFVQQATDLARVTGSELPQAINTLDSILNSYSLTASDAEKVSAILFKTIDVGRININELSNTFGRVGPLAQSLGVDFTEVAATMAITTQKGTKTADAMTLLTNLLNKLEKPTTGSKNFLKEVFGTESGEAAIAASGGLLPLIEKIVEATRTGKAQVSDFFDEIRGRKQFAVFEQSLPEIKKFAAELQNTGKVISDYKKAVAIRGESPADELVKEANKLKNAFTVDLGQSLLQGTAQIVKYVGGFDTIKQGVENTLPTIERLTLGFGAYAVGAGVARLANVGLSTSFNILTTSLLRLAPVLIPVAAAITTYNIASAAIKNQKNFGSNIDTNQFEETFQTVNDLRAKAAKETPFEFKFKGLEDLKKDSASAYGELIKYIGAAQKANDKLNDEVREKTKDATEAAKVSFGALADSIREKMSDARKNISKATEEIQNSAKRVLKFSDSIDQLIYNVREKYANDDFGQQKINLTGQQIEKLKAKAKELGDLAIGAPDAEKAAEYTQERRRVIDELAQLETKRFELVTDHQKKEFEQYLKTHPTEAQRPGGNLFLVDTLPVEKELLELKKQEAEFEDKIQQSQKKRIDGSKQVVATEEARLRTLELAFKDYEKIDLLDKEGNVKGEFKTAGKFDQGKLNAAIQKSEDAIRAAAGNSGDVNTRFKLESDLSARRIALSKEAAVAERAENLKTAESKALADKQAAEQTIDDIKKKREELLKDQDRFIASGSQKQNELRAFGNIVGGSGAVDTTDKKFIDDAINKYNAAFEKLRDNRKNVNGVTFLDPNLIEEANQAYKDVLATVEKIRDRTAGKGDFSTPGATARTLGNREIDWSTPGSAFKSAFNPDPDKRPNGPALELQGANGQGPITIGEARAAADELARKAKLRSSEILGNISDEKAKRAEFDSGLGKQVEALKKQFPELASQVAESTQSMDTSFRNLANGGLKDLVNKLKEANDLLPKVQNAGPNDTGKRASGKVGIADFDSTGVTYAASGGIVGQFPGQPRGVDVYPVWAAKGEVIVNAETAAMYKPMLSAIMSRQMPRYMAAGGVVGGDTTIGDINITVNGATTNEQTARIIGNRLERQLKRGNIRL